METPTLEKPEVKKRGRKPKDVSVIASPAPKNEMAELKDLVLSQQLVLNKLLKRQHYLEESVRNWCNLGHSLGGSFAKFKFDPPKDD